MVAIRKTTESSAANAQSHVYAVPAASPEFIKFFAATVAAFFPDQLIRVEGAPTARRVLKKYPDASFIEPAAWLPARPTHYLCLIAPLTWPQLEKQVILDPNFMSNLVARFGSAQVGEKDSEENQYLYLSAEILTLIGATYRLDQAFKKSPTPSQLERVRALVEKHADRRYIYETVLGLSKGSYERAVAGFCMDLVTGSAVAH